MHESGGNPSAVNNTDINAQRGDPSRGLFQTIMATFQAYALSGHGNIFNPVDNAAAAIGYIKSRYGDVFHVPGIMSLASGGPYVGYANGTNNATQGWHLVGERGPELTYLPSGAKVVPNNRVGNVLSSSQTSNQPINITIVMDGQRVANVLMPHLADNLRYGAGIQGI
jgi:SLT domain-containing protein